VLTLAMETKVINRPTPRVDVETLVTPWQVVPTAIIFMLFI
jgi:hypothetical protein